MDRDTVSRWVVVILASAIAIAMAWHVGHPACTPERAGEIRVRDGIGGGRMFACECDEDVCSWTEQRQR